MSLPTQNTPRIEPFKAIAKSTMALVRSIPMFMPMPSSAAVTKRAQELAYSDYATISKVDNGTRLEFISEPSIVAEELASGLDLLFPDARRSNAYEQKLVADLMDEFFE
jgi:hypothetical protein